MKQNRDQLIQRLNRISMKMLKGESFYDTNSQEFDIIQDNISKLIRSLPGEIITLVLPNSDESGWEEIKIELEDDTNREQRLERFLTKRMKQSVKITDGFVYLKHNPRSARIWKCQWWCLIELKKLTLFWVDFYAKK